MCLILKSLKQLCDWKKKRAFPRVFSILLTVFLLLPVFSNIISVALGNSVSLSAERDIQPGSSFTVRLSLETAEIGYEGHLSYDESVLILTRITPVNNDSYIDFQVSTESGYVSVTHSEPVRRMLQLTFSVSSDAEIGSETVVRFYSGNVLRDGGAEAVDDVAFEFRITDRKSSDATLRSLEVLVFKSESDRDQNKNAFSASLTPVFSSDNETYSTTVANEYSFFQIVATPKDSGAAVVSGSDGELTEGDVNTVALTVEAEDGSEKTYYIQIFRESVSHTSVETSFPISDVTSEESAASSEETASEETADASDFLSEEMSDSQSGESDAGSSIDLSESFVSRFSESSFAGADDTKNWTGIILCIAAIGALTLFVLMLRIFILFHKKQK